MDWKLIKGIIYKINTIEGSKFAAKFTGKSNGRLIFQSRNGIVSAHYPDELTFVKPVLRQDALQ